MKQIPNATVKTIDPKPFNAEPPPTFLPEVFFTPNELFYVRNHLPVPLVEKDEFELTIEIERSTVMKDPENGKEEVEYDYRELSSFSYSKLG